MESEDEHVEEPDRGVVESSGFRAPLLIWFELLRKQTAKIMGAILLVIAGVVQLLIGK